MSDLITLACGHIYSRATWKEDSTCFYCEAIKNNTCSVNGITIKKIRGYCLQKDGKAYRMKTLKQMALLGNL